MSDLENAIDNLLNTLQSLSTTYRSGATNLINSADNIIQGVKSPDVPNLEYDVNREFVGVQRVPLPPKVKNVSSLVMPHLDDLQSISGINDQFTTEEPEFSWPEFSYDKVSSPSGFTKKAPTPKSLEIESPESELAPFNPPTLTKPAEVSVETLEMTPPGLTPLEIEELPANAADILTPYKEQLNAIMGEFSEWRNWLLQQGTLAQELSALIGTRLRKILEGEETALTDNWETQTFQQMQHEIFMQRHAGLLELDAAPGSITGTPSGLRDYTRLKLELQTLQSLMVAAGKTAVTRYQEESQHLKWALQLALKWTEILAGLFADVQAWKLQGILIAVEGAQAALNATVKVLGLKEKELKLRISYNDAQLSRLGLLVKIERTKLEKLQVQTANNQLIATYNDHQAAIDMAATVYVKSRLDLFDAQITYLLADQEWQKLEYERFEAEVAAYKVSVDAVKAEQLALKARIKGDLALADTELAKAQTYTATLQAQETNVRALAAKSKVQADRMQQILTAYNTEVTAKLAWLKELNSVVNLAVRAIIKEFDAENKVEMIKLARQEVEDQDNLNRAWESLREDQRESLRIVKGHALQVMQAKATGQVISQGSGTLGSLAQAAYAGLNGIGARQIIEEA